MDLYMSTELQNSIQTLKGVGEKSAALYAKLHIFTIGDLLRFYPRDYEVYEAPVSVREGKDGEINSFFCTITAGGSLKRVRGLSILNFTAADETGQLRLTFFNMPYLKNSLKKGTAYVFRGLFRDGKMEHPRIFSPEEYEKLRERIQPTYSLTKGLTNHSIKKAITGIFTPDLELPEYLPLYLRQKYDLMGYEEALYTIHFPDSFEALRKARRRLVFDEFFLFLLLVRKNKTAYQKKESPYTILETADVKRLTEALPYRLTGGQQQALSEILQDMTEGTVMSRLVQGDVGSGKTILAVLALLLCVTNGYQGALMAPTEVLAEQHFQTIKELTEQYKLPFTPVLLTGSVSAKEKREIYAGIEEGTYNLLIGTHALIQDPVNFKNLALVITDEQHRFGVRQRETLACKGQTPHVLVMSATPIPRSLALILYGDLSVSCIRELPAQRLPIKNCVIGSRERSKAYRFMEQEIAKGHQIYIICPMVEEGNAEGLENVTDYSQKLKSIFPENIQIGTLHGKMKPSEKKRIMEEFHRHDIDILVSTTVIEVGINVPNATVMMVENAERFGLAQLHQLRGRVGRGKAQSYCIFVNSKEKADAGKRLQILTKSNDGFQIAEEDLKLRGPGDLFGIRQSGAMSFRLADIFQDSSVLLDAGNAVDEIYAGKGEISPEMLPFFIQNLENATGNYIDFQSI